VARELEAGCPHPAFPRPGAGHLQFWPVEDCTGRWGLVDALLALRGLPIVRALKKVSEKKVDRNDIKGINIANRKEKKSRRVVRSR